MQGKNFFDWLVIILLVVGGLNWGSVGLFNYNLVSDLFSGLAGATRVIYALAGVAAIYIALRARDMVRCA